MKIFVGMSGGVDSSLTALLLKEQGYDVTGVYMKNWTEDLPGMRCPWADDLADAKRIAVQIGIPFKVYDFQDEYKQSVVDYMIEEYKAGRTPNPDIMCNQEVKFRLFLQTALQDSADAIATGHYAQVHNGFSPEPDNETARLLMAVDTNKDQTYFLYRVSSSALAKTLFPLGAMKKTEVRALAHQKGLSTADKKDSQGICFVGSVGIRDFLSQYVETTPGNVIERDTHNVIGEHEGAIYYTLGQRHGMSLGGGLPYYVVGKDMDKNEVYVSRNLNDDSMWRNRFQLSDIHWINAGPNEGDELHVRLRHRGELFPAQLKGDTLSLNKTERAVASGQSAVIYRGDECLGGGFVV